MKTTRVIRKPQKKQKLKEEKEIDGNRNSKSLGNLPEEILRQILSFLPTKDAVRTSVVCKRWEYLWARIPNLDFAQHEPAKALCKSKRTVFMKFVDRALRLRDSSVIRRFALRYAVQSDASRVDRWISMAVRHNVQELYIVLDSFKGEFSLPYCLFTCATLTSLHLDMPNFLKLPTAICFSNLKILAIERVTFSDEYLTQQFFSGLLLLEKLELHQCSWGDLKVVRISAPKLHSLSICEFDRRNSIYGNDCEVMIFGVCLEEFNYKGFLFSDYCLYESFSLKKADIYIYHDNPSVEIVDRTNKLLSGLTNVEFLKFYSGVFKVRMYAAKFLTHMPMFHNLMTLVFDGTSLVLDFEALLNILQRFPCLENLEILGGIILSSNCEEDDRILTPCFLSHLKCIKVGRYHGDKEELSVVKILLKNSLVLEEIVITCPGYFTWNLKKQESFYKQLIELPKGSQNCKIVLK